MLPTLKDKYIAWMQFVFSLLFMTLGHYAELQLFIVLVPFAGFCALITLGVTP